MSTSSQSSNRTTDGGPFIRGPFFWDFWMAVAALGSDPVRIALATRYWSGWRLPRGRSRGTRVGFSDLGALGLDRRAVRIALRRLERAGLASVERGTGRKPIIVLTEWSDCPARTGPGVRIDHMSWAWWYVALQLGGAAPMVAVALWSRADEWDVDRAFDIPLSDVPGCSRWAAGRGLRALEVAQLVRVERRPGMAPIVTIISGFNG
jgi:hypothetical protein